MEAINWLFKSTKVSSAIPFSEVDGLWSVVFNDDLDFIAKFIILAIKVFILAEVMFKIIIKVMMAMILYPFV